MTLDAGTSYESANVDGYAVSSNTESSEEIKQNLTEPKDGAEEDPEQEASEAAKKLGARGGKAAAEKRAAEAKTKPEADDDEEEPAAKEEKLGKPRHDPKARMLEATRKEADAKRRAQAAEERAERLEREVAEIKRTLRPATPEQPRQAAPQADDDEEPQEDQFDSYKDYVRAAARYEYRQERKQEQARAQREAMAHGAASAVVEARKAARERITAYEAQNPGFWDRVSDDVKSLDPTHSLRGDARPDASNFLADEIITSGNGPALMVHLSDHPEDFQRISALSSRRDVAIAIAKLEARLEAATAGTSSPAPVSKAKPPVRPVTGSPVTADDDLPSDDEPYEVWKRKADAMDAKRRRQSVASMR